MEKEMTKQTTTADPLAGLRLLSFKKVRELTTFSGQQIRIMAKQDKFPRPIQLAQRRIAFVEVEVLDWLRQRAQQRRTPSAWVSAADEAEAGAMA
jgi:predicted DNA-binding transcriptional regulator AlpA